jgi:transketolase
MISHVDGRKMADAIRFLSLDAIERACEGHPGAPLGGAEITTALFTRHLKCNPRDPTWPDRDRFVLSNGHGSMLIYSLLHLAGYETMTIDEIKRFRELGSHAPGHPERDPSAGIEVTTGPLGQGIANAVGMAVAEAWLSTTLGSDVVDHRTYALVGDGCLMEGVAYEVIALAGHLRLGKLTFLWDDNRMTDDGAITLGVSEDVRAHFRNAGWQVIDADGHDIEAVSKALTLAKSDPRPTMIACRTLIGKGSPRLENTRAAHGGRVYTDDLQQARAAANWPYSPFVVPDDVRTAWKAGVEERNRPAYEAWKQRIAALPPDRRAEFERLMRGDLPAGWCEALMAHSRRMAEEKPKQPSIRSAGDVVQLLAGIVPEFMSGSPDLEASTNCKRGLPEFTAANHGGRYIHYGVREHAMAAMMNGMVAHGGVLPVGATYLAFSDYMRPALRMAAMMELPVVSILSHDSIGVGKNGPTHQPVETMASLRAMPNFALFRPADAVEMAECWAVALARRAGPSTIVCTRQPLPAVRTEPSSENLCARGAYVIAEAPGGKRQVTLLATGSEVAVALAARETLQAQGIAAAVVSMPCWEVFAQQDDAYRASVLGPAEVRIGIEAAVDFGWQRWLGPNGIFVGMTGFGASGPVDELFRHFGITPQAVVAAALSRLQQLDRAAGACRREEASVA